MRCEYAGTTSEGRVKNIRKADGLPSTAEEKEAGC